ncbi:MAG: DUF4097 family beta strand repeat-containing protein [Dehalococcoidia bacterium]
MADPHVFAAEGIERIRVSTLSGSVAVLAEARADIVVEKGGAGAKASAGTLTVTSHSGPVVIRCPEHSNIVVGTASGGISLRGRLGEVAASSPSGGIRIEHATSADVRGGSGTVQVDRAEGRCRLAIKSGRATIGSAGELSGASISGQVVATVTGPVSVRTVSGNVDASAAGEGDVEVETLSGSVTVRLPHGVRPRARLRSRSGRSRCDCPQGDDLEVAIQSLSGRIVVTGQ